VKGWPLKKVAWMSFGAIGSAAQAVLAVKSMHTTANGPARIEDPLGAIITPVGRRDQQRV